MWIHTLMKFASSFKLECLPSALSESSEWIIVKLKCLWSCPNSLHIGHLWEGRRVSFDLISLKASFQCWTIVLSNWSTEIGLRRSLSLQRIWAEVNPSYWKQRFLILRSGAISRRQVKGSEIFKYSKFFFIDSHQVRFLFQIRKSTCIIMGVLRHETYSVISVQPSLSCPC